MNKIIQDCCVFCYLLFLEPVGYYWHQDLLQQGGCLDECTSIQATEHRCRNRELGAYVLEEELSGNRIMAFRELFYQHLDLVDKNLAVMANGVSFSNVEDGASKQFLDVVEQIGEGFEGRFHNTYIIKIRIQNYQDRGQITHLKQILNSKYEIILLIINTDYIQLLILQQYAKMPLQKNSYILEFLPKNKQQSQKQSVNQTQMQQTIRTKNYNATITIPYEKLASKHNCIPLDSLIQSSNHCHHDKTIQIQGCTQNNRNDGISMQMLEELEVAFQADIKEKDRVIEEFRKQVEGLKAGLEGRNREVQQIRRNAMELDRNYFEAAKTIKQQENGLQQAAAENQKLTYDFRLLSQQNENLKHLLSETQGKLSENQKELGATREKLAVEEFRNDELNKQIDRLSESLDKVTNTCGQYELQCRQLNAAKENYLKKIYELQSQIRQLVEKISSLTSQNQTSSTTILQKNQHISQLNSTISGLKQQIKQLEKQLQDKQYLIRTQQSQLNSLKDRLSQLQQMLKKSQDTSKILAMDLAGLRRDQDLFKESNMGLEKKIKELSYRCSSYENEVYDRRMENQLLVKKVVELENTIAFLEKQLREKETPKNFEVRIERVIDKQDYITQIEAKLEASSQEIASLGSRVKQLEKLLAGKDGEIQEVRMSKVELENAIKNLTSYIEQKERSFAWIVEKQLLKDIEQNCPDGKIPTYKVSPTSINIQARQILRSNITTPPNLNLQNVFSQPQPQPQSQQTTITNNNILHEFSKGRYNQQLQDLIHRETS